MSVKKPPNSPYYHYAFEFRGHRFRGSTKARSRREAEAFERREREAAERLVAEQAGAKTSLRLTDIADRYWLDKWEGRAGDGPKNVKRQLARLIEFFGEDRLITDIGGDDVAKLVAWRRGHQVVGGVNRKPAGRLIGPFAVNDTTEQLKKLINHAKRTWEVVFPREIAWAAHWRREPEPRKNELRGDQGERLQAAARDEFQPILRLAEITGLRQQELLLRWDEVDWDAGMIVKKGKGDRTVTAPIMPDVRALLWPLRGDHAEFVFTYICQRPRAGMIKGRRYPVTQSGLKSHWRRLRVRAGVQGFRFHDYRHDFGTKMLRETHDIELVSQLMNHSSLEMTRRYAHVMTDDKRKALADREAARAAEAATRRDNLATETPPKNPPLASKKT